MDKNIKGHGALKRYLYWPVILTLLLIVMNLFIYLIDKDAGFMVTIFVLIYFIITTLIFIVRRDKIANELIIYAMDYGQVQKRMLKELDLPYAIINLDGRIQWGNDEFMDLLKEKDSSKKNLSQIFPELTEEHLPDQVLDEEVYLEYNERNYRVLLRNLLVPSLDSDKNWDHIDATKLEDEGYSLVAIYFYDETENVQLQKDNRDQKLITGLLYIDNYEEALVTVEEVRRSLLTALVDRKINKYMQGLDAIIKKLEKDKYVFVMQYKYLSQLQESKFSILEEVRNINIGNDMAVTISIGLGVNADTYNEGYEYARAAMDLALGRGGDQAVVKNREKISYYGGKSIQVEKNTRVKARVKAQAFRELVETKDKIIVMGHKIGDVDSFGASIGVYRIAKAFNKKVHIVINEVTNSLRSMMSRFVDNPEYEEDLFLNNEQVLEVVDADTLLVIVDTNKPSLLECEELVDYCDTIVIFDHHRQTDEAINKAVLSYIEPFASSTSEMIAEILQYIGGNLKLKPLEADALYAGIMIDTNNFLTKTGVRTFEAAAYLRRNGADVTRLRKSFRSDVIDVKAKADAIANAEIFEEEFAIATCDGTQVESPTVLAAQIANELLNVAGIKATFVFTDYNNKVYVSARSIDEVNVQVIMEKFGGGGHLSVAGCQLEGTSVDEAIEDLKATLLSMIENNEL